MKVEIKRLGVLRIGIFLAAFYGLFSIVILPFLTLGVLLNPPEKRAEVVPMVLMVLLYPLMGFLGGIIAAAAYNLIAFIIGGVKLEMNVEPVPQQAGSVPGHVEMVGIQGLGTQD